MIDDNALDQYRRPTLTRPLLGLTILAVEDSRYASDALRLLCLHSGARLRRADCLGSARRHLKVYRPSVVVVDMGLPDGSGADLIAEMSAAFPRISVILGSSGDSFAEDLAYAAGADGFLAKPISSIAMFQNAILQHLPPERQPVGVRAVRTDTIQPDAIAFREDMAHVAEILSGPVDDKTLDYVTLFVSGIARTAEDAMLEAAASDLAEARLDGAPLTGQTARLAGLVQARLSDAVAI
jgi:CheY-like chemotaxis protein